MTKSKFGIHDRWRKSLNILIGMITTCVLLVNRSLGFCRNNPRQKVAKMRFRHLSYRWLSDIAFLPPFPYTIDGLLFWREPTVCLSRLSRHWHSINWQHMWISRGRRCTQSVSTSGRELASMRQEQKGDKMRFHHLSYRWLSEITHPCAQNLIMDCRQEYIKEPHGPARSA